MDGASYLLAFVLIIVESGSVSVWQADRELSGTGALQQLEGVLNVLKKVGQRAESLADLNNFNTKIKWVSFLLVDSTVAASLRLQWG